MPERVKHIRNLVIKRETPKDMMGKATRSNAMPPEKIVKAIQYIDSILNMKSAILVNLYFIYLMSFQFKKCMNYLM